MTLLHINRSNIVSILGFSAKEGEKKKPKNDYMCMDFIR